ncbi:MAG: LysR family transcriptional regulator [Pseudomonadota bacterium]
MNISGLDLNLLRVFDAVYRDRNATKAARRIGLSQPAVSNALSRLRTQLNDQLFQRAPEGLRPTPRADALAGPIRAALALLEEAIEGPEFLPAQTRRIFRIAAVDYATTSFLPHVAARVASEAPKARLLIRPSLGSTLDHLDDGTADLGLFIRDAPPERFEVEHLHSVDFVVVRRADHPVPPGALDLEAYLAYPHVLASPQGDMSGSVDTILSRKGLTRRVALVVSEYALAPPFVSGTDMLHTCPAPFAELYARPMGLVVEALPLEERPALGRLSMVWHRRLGATMAGEWLRGLVREAVAARLGDGAG